MIGEAGGDGGGSGLRAVVGIFLSEGSNGPAEVVAVEGEVTNRFVGIPFFAEAVGLADLAAVAVSVGAVLAFDERGVDLLADRRIGQGRCDGLGCPEHDVECDVDDASFLTFFVHCGVVQVAWGDLV